MYVYAYIRKYVHMYMDAQHSVYTKLHVREYTNERYIHKYKYGYVCMRIHTYICPYVYEYASFYIYSGIRADVNTRTSGTYIYVVPM